jgi:Mg2+ and Co2+ transporter CorA
VSAASSRSSRGAAAWGGLTQRRCPAGASDLGPWDDAAGGRVPKIANALGDYFREVYEHLTQIDRSIEGVLEMLRTAVQVKLGLINLNATEVTKKLAA